MELHSAIQNDLVTRLLYIYINILPIIYCLLIALMHICSVILHMGLGPRTKAQGAAGPGPYIYTHYVNIILRFCFWAGWETKL